MTPFLKFVLFQTAVLVPFITGCLLRKKFSAAEAATRKILNANIILIEPLIIIWCIWELRFSPGLALLPAAGLYLVLLGLITGMACGPVIQASGMRKQTFLVSASLANHGFTMGGFLCYFFLGEKGLGLSIILVLYFIPYVYGFIFPAARKASGRPGVSESYLKNIISDPRSLPLFALILAVLLNVSGLKRPAVAFPVEALLLLSIALYYLSLGINFNGLAVRAYPKEHLLLAVVKFIIVPLATFLLLKLIGPPADVAAVIMIQSFMPAAIFSVVVSVLFNLDAKLASSLFVLNTLVFLLVILPVMFIGREWLF